MNRKRTKELLLWRKTSIFHRDIVYCFINTITMADAILFRIQGVRNAAYPQRYVRDNSALIQNPITMADAILFRIQGARNAAYPRRYVSNEQRRRRQKRFSPEGISSLVNFFLILRSRTTKGTPCSLFVGIASNLNIPLSADFKSEHLQRRRQKKEHQPEGNVIFGQFIPLSSLTDHKGYATLIVRWN